MIATTTVQSIPPPHAMRVCLLAVLTVLCGARGLGIEPGPQIIATQGQVWPKPQRQIYFDSYLTVDPANFKFTIEGESCDILDAAVVRYQEVLLRMRKAVTNAHRKLRLRHKSLTNDKDYAGDLRELRVTLSTFCEILPYHNMDEEYELRVNSLDLPGAARLSSLSVWGILRGLETFVQLLYPTKASNKLLINSTSILDYPRFPYRGLHMDTARHFMPMRIILSMLEAMSMNKFNVFHWHIVDDQSFPYQSLAWPELSAQGAYSPLHVYTPADVAQVIEAARLRGIRVIPEFDTPGHTRSWGIAYPDLLTQCYGDDGQPDGTLGPMNPISNFTYTFMDSLLQELATIFPDRYFHVGGDEVPFDCWKSNPALSRFMEDNAMTPENLEGLYISRIIQRVSSLKHTPIVWQEVFDNGDLIPNTTVVHVWKDWIDYRAEMASVTRAGYRALFSSCWYLDHLTTGGDWEKFYDCDPTFFPGTEAQRRLVVGGEACMWAEVVDATNVQTRVWPRASAVAEKLWSAANVDSIKSARERIEEHACRMNMRGIPAPPPNGPGFCPYQLYKESNPKISQFLEDNQNMSLSNLESLFISRTLEKVTSLGQTPIVWQEVFDNGDLIQQETIVHVWKDWIDYMDEMSNVTQAGYRVILSSCYYMSHLSTGGDWQKFYDCDPTFFPGTDAQRRRVLGGAACMWGENVDTTIVETRVWPRASAVAERLWSASTVDDVREASGRLEEHACRMNLRGISAQPPNGPGFCPYQLVD